VFQYHHTIVALVLQLSFLRRLRTFAISLLSNEHVSEWTAVEKIQLARAHKVSKWFKEGLDALVSGQEQMTCADLQPLGAETMAIIFLLKEQAGGDKVKSESSGTLRTKDVRC